MIKMWTCAAVLPLLVLTAPAEAQDPDQRYVDAVVAAIDRARTENLRDVNEMQVRTFKLVHLDSLEAWKMVQPYVLAPGTTSHGGGTLTVREMPPVLDRIADALNVVDVPPATPQFHFQFIKANGSERTDPRIADIEEALRRALRFDGYSLVGEAIASGRKFTIRVPTGGPAEYEIQALHSNVYHDLEVELWRTPGNADADAVRLLATTVGIRLGQTLILGSTSDSGETLLFVVRMVEG